MRISDWSSDVCSSDLLIADRGRETGRGADHQRDDQRARIDAQFGGERQRHRRHQRRDRIVAEQFGQEQRKEIDAEEIGGASGRERGCEYVWISVVAVTVKKIQIRRPRKQNIKTKKKK